MSYNGGRYLPFLEYGSDNWRWRRRMSDWDNPKWGEITEAEERAIREIFRDVPLKITLLEKTPREPVKGGEEPMEAPPDTLTDLAIKEPENGSQEHTGATTEEPREVLEGEVLGPGQKPGRVGWSHSLDTRTGKWTTEEYLEPVVDITPPPQEGEEE